MSNEASQNHQQRVRTLKIKIGTAALELRQSLGLTQRAAAEKLGISYVHLCNIENDKADPSTALLDRYRELWGVDLYVYAWCRNGDVSKLPKPMQKAAEALSAGWRKQISSTMSTRGRNSRRGVG